MARISHPRPAARAVAGLALAALVSWPAPGVAGATGRGEGRVLAASGVHVLVSASTGTAILRLRPGVSLVGPADPLDLLPGDLVRYEWSGEAAGVLQVERLEAPPPVRVPAGLGVAPATLAALLQSAASPLLLDVRSPARHRAGRLPGARTAPPGLGPPELAALPPGAPVVIYGEDDRSEEAPALLRRLLAQGRTGARVLEGGVRRWSLEGHPLQVEPSEAARRLGAAPGLLALDVRPGVQVAEGTLPGAVSVSAETVRLRDFDGERPLLPLLLVGAGPRDPAVASLAERIRLARAGGEGALPLELLVLEGGFPAWRSEGLPAERGAPRVEIPFRPQLEGEIDPAEFLRLWRSEGAGVTLLDVRWTTTVTQPWVVKIPLEELSDRLGELPPGRPVVVFCTKGLRSRIAREILVRSGLRAGFLRGRGPE